MDTFWWFIIGVSIGTLIGASLGYFTAHADIEQARLNRKLNKL